LRNALMLRLRKKPSLTSRGSAGKREEIEIWVSQLSSLPLNRPHIRPSHQLSITDQLLQPDTVTSLYPPRLDLHLEAYLPAAFRLNSETSRRWILGQKLQRVVGGQQQTPRLMSKRGEEAVPKLKRGVLQRVQRWKQRMSDRWRGTRTV